MIRIFLFSFLSVAMMFMTQNQIYAQCSGTIGAMGADDDYDGDGYCNAIDLDDDNDGILDSDEGVICTAEILPDSVSTTATNVGPTRPLTNTIDGLLTTFGGTPGGVAALNGSVTYYFDQSIQYVDEFIIYPNGGNNLADAQVSNIDTIIFYDFNDTPVYAVYNIDVIQGSVVNHTVVNLPSLENISHFTMNGIADSVNFAEAIWKYVAIKGCKFMDTDGDTYPDHMDMDADGDGCVDAVEGTGGFTHANLNLMTGLQSTVDANGVPTTAASGQGVGTSQDSSTQSVECDPCNSISTLFTDTDGDGIGDACDLDNDNDGILDTDEGKICSSEAFPDSVSTTATNISASNPLTNTIDGSISTFGGALNSAEVDGAVTYYYSSPLNMVSEFVIYSNGGIDLTDEQLTHIDTLKFYNASDSLVYTITNINITQASINNTTIVSLPEIQEVSSFEMIGIADRVDSLSAIWRYVALNGCSSADTDGDGIPDFKDLDADGDGCPDAIEGGAGFSSSDVSNDTLVGGVDANGVPLAAGSVGQTVGSSIDSTVNTCVVSDSISVQASCPSCVALACPTADDIVTEAGSSTCGTPSGYTVTGPNADGCFEYIADSTAADTTYTCVYTCDAKGFCDTTVVMLLAPKITADSVFMPAPSSYTSPTLVCATADNVNHSETISYSTCSVPSGYTVTGPDSSGCFTYVGSSSVTDMDTTCVYACDLSGACDTTYVILQPYSISAGVAYSDLEVTQTGCDNFITWTTDMEENTDKAEIWKSFGPNSEYFMVGSVPLSSRSSTKKYYRYRDADASYYPSYYQVRMVDIDGNRVNTEVMFAESNGCEFRDVLNIYPNPSRSSVNIEYISNSEQAIRIQISNMLGQVVYYKELIITHGMNHMDLDFSNFANGLYQVILIDENNNLLDQGQIQIVK